ncbi:Importin beta family like protein [Aduncisulcus paluster]|uniref:Importin beta family like protein n=1 Tax=Aduncisulcus paluster TaxID=2918883 RepID=A0ABQ5KH02_9EUKA|nr:Importin beta family like protein [Aduncisulcus paluster]|eukprot:gnl/Carplike_NY0171/2997_a4030_493.p1 GENE.gnl/Carplike_NY0171/2997_a4030_493~~gnl/Carplike_NY0171/2997_a4030_493.p1  ORF type:complete len:1242 (-),score=424.02 gnl/Carplike_NY0171/2997_a4030_493:70-3795(-)
MEEVKSFFEALNDPKHPNYGTVLGIEMNLRNNEIEKALSLYEKALELSDPNLRALALVLLRRLLNGNTGSFIRDNTKPALSRNVKEMLLRHLEKESVPQVRKKVIEAIGSYITHIAVGISDKTGVSFPEIVKKFFAWLDSPKWEIKKLSLQLFTECTGHLIDMEDKSHHEEFLQKIYEKFHGLLEIAPSPKDLGLIMNCLCKIPSISSKCSTYTPLIQLIFKTILKLLSHKEEGAQAASNILTSLIDLCLYKPMFLAPHVKFLHANLKDIAANPSMPSSIRSYAFQAETTLCEQLTSTMRREVPHLASELLPVAALFLANEMKDDIDVWSKAERIGDYVTTQATVDVQDATDRICQFLGSSIVTPVIMDIVKQASASPDWKFRYIACSLLTLAAEGIGRGGVSEKIMEGFLKHLLHLAKDPHVRVQWCFANCIARLCIDFKPSFATKYGKHLIEMIAEMGAKSDSPRVKSRCCGAIAAVFDHGAPELVSECADYVINSVKDVLKIQGRGDTMKSGVILLATFAVYMEEEFIPLYDGFMPAILDMLEKFTAEAEKADGKEETNHGTIRGKLIDCAASMGESVGKKPFMKHAKRVINLLYRSLFVLSKNADDMACGDLMDALQSVARVLKEDFADGIPTLLPPLLEVATKSDDVITAPKAVDIEEDGEEFLDFGNVQFQVNNTSLEERADALKTIDVFLLVVPQACIPFLKDIFNAAISGIKNVFSDNAKKYSADIIGKMMFIIVSSEKLTDHQKEELVTMVVKDGLETIVRNMETEGETDVLMTLIDAMSSAVMGVKATQFAPVFMDHVEVIISPIEYIFTNLGEYIETEIASQMLAEDIQGDIAGAPLEYFGELSPSLQHILLEGLLVGEYNPEKFDSDISDSILDKAGDEAEDMIDAIQRIQLRGETIRKILVCVQTLLGGCIAVLGLPFVVKMNAAFGTMFQQWVERPVHPIYPLPCHKAAFISIAIDVLVCLGNIESPFSAITTRTAMMSEYAIGELSEESKKRLTIRPEGHSDSKSGEKDIVKLFVSPLLSSCVQLFKLCECTVAQRNAAFGISVIAERYPEALTPEVQKEVIIPFIVRSLKHEEQYEPERSRLTDCVLTMLLRCAVCLPDLRFFKEQSLELSNVIAECIRRLPETRGDILEARMLLTFLIELMKKGKVEDVDTFVHNCLKLFFAREREEEVGEMQGLAVLDKEGEKAVIDLCILYKEKEGAKFAKIMESLSESETEKLREKIAQLK